MSIQPIESQLLVNPTPMPFKIEGTAASVSAIPLSGNKEMPLIGLGTYRIEKESLLSALHKGFCHLDTAKAYQNESMIGEAIHESGIHPDLIFITTKLHQEALQQPIEKVVLESNQKIGKHVDLVLIHAPYPDMTLVPILQQLNACQAAGLIGHYGVSNFNKEQLSLCLAHGFPVAINQVEYHPYFQQSELHAFCKENNVVLVAYRPLSKGQVIGDTTITEIANRHHKQPAQIVWRWLIQKGIPIVSKASTPIHQEEYLDALHFTLNDEEIKKIDDLHQGESRRTCIGPWLVQV